MLPRMNCVPGVDDIPIPGFRRCQFLVRVCFAMTINKAQGQSVPGKLGVDLTSFCFAHGQLCVALPRATHPGKVFVCTEDGKSKTENVVYPEVLSGAGALIPSSAIKSGKQAKPVYLDLAAAKVAQAKVIDLDDEPDFEPDGYPVDKYVP